MQTVLVGADPTPSSTQSGISSPRSTARNEQMRPERTAFGLLTHRKTRLEDFGRSFSSSDQLTEIGHSRSIHINAHFSYCPVREHSKTKFIKSVPKRFPQDDQGWDIFKWRFAFLKEMMIEMGKPFGTNLSLLAFSDTTQAMEQQTSRSFTSGNSMLLTRHSNLLPCFFSQQADSCDLPRQSLFFMP
jgi:hypothetical protein